MDLSTSHGFGTMDAEPSCYYRQTRIKTVSTACGGAIMTRSSALAETRGNAAAAN